MNYKCIIVDDEQLARDLLEVYAKRIPVLTVIAKCKSAMEVEELLKNYQPDILLSDIEMPIKSGIDLISQLNTKPKVIFTTAYQEYALKGYELEVVDYLLKPIGFERFAKAIEKAIQIIETERKANAFEEEKNLEEQFIIIKQGYEQHKIFLKNILYVEAMREYVVYHTIEGKLMELQPISQLEKSLPEQQFMRVHRSFIVAKSEIKSLQTNKITLSNSKELPIGKTYRKLVKTLLG